MILKKGMFVFVIILLAVSIIGCSSEVSTKPQQTQQTSTPTSTPISTSTPESIISVTAKKLISDYDSNEIAADEKYKGKIITVTGEIDSVSKDILKQPFISLNYGCKAYFDKKYEKQLINLSKGDIVTVQCKCDGRFIFVTLKDCILISTTLKTTPTSTPKPTPTPIPTSKLPDVIVYVEGDQGIKFQGSIMIIQGTKSVSKSVQGTTPAKYEFDDVTMISVSFQKMSGGNKVLKVRIYDPQTGEDLVSDSTDVSYGLVVLTTQT
ncbi:hypothetical protein DRP07_09830 [Archaeoglobales archaeon]|nr:MAG: hypothetical protein DRP07_09830 [Archaeoglobales archaeon]